MFPLTDLSQLFSSDSLTQLCVSTLCSCPRDNEAKLCVWCLPLIHENLLHSNCCIQASLIRILCPQQRLITSKAAMLREVAAYFILSSSTRRESFVKSEISSTFLAEEHWRTYQPRSTLHLSLSEICGRFISLAPPLFSVKHNALLPVIYTKWHKFKPKHNKRTLKRNSIPTFELIQLISIYEFDIKK